MKWILVSMIMLAGHVYAGNEPANLRVHVMVIGLSGESLGLLSKDGKAEADYQSARKWVDAGKAEVLEVLCLNLPDGQNGMQGGYQEWIYPLHEDGKSKAELIKAQQDIEFERRDIGAILSVSADADSTGQLKLWFVDQPGVRAWMAALDQKDELVQRVPSFLVHHVSAKLPGAGQGFQLVKVMAGKDGAGKDDPARKLLVFAKLERR
ncbi:hypothetical protein Rhal01_03141 [Rubritalea halochordaticola]|uniref:DUF2066 domain-containing protein n=1 Tax=Rubritalea halochordaticola TaxID=714537 RepID=A0ABP9V2Q0_9BACT